MNQPTSLGIWEGPKGVIELQEISSNLLEAVICYQLADKQIRGGLESRIVQAFSAQNPATREVRCQHHHSPL